LVWWVAQKLAAAARYDGFLFNSGWLAAFTATRNGIYAARPNTQKKKNKKREQKRRREQKKKETAYKEKKNRERERKRARAESEREGGPARELYHLLREVTLASRHQPPRPQPRLAAVVAASFSPRRRR
jgi:hypothetical protein